MKIALTKKQIEKFVEYEINKRAKKELKEMEDELEAEFGHFWDKMQYEYEAKIEIWKEFNPNIPVPKKNNSEQLDLFFSNLIKEKFISVINNDYEKFHLLVGEIADNNFLLTPKISNNKEEIENYVNEKINYFESNLDIIHLYKDIINMEKLLKNYKLEE